MCRQSKHKFPAYSWFTSLSRPKGAASGNNRNFASEYILYKIINTAGMPSQCA